jgi:hypothetical protein
MIIYGALLIPIIIGVLCFIFARKNMQWWEALPALLIGLVLTAGFKACVETAQTRDKEYWGGYITAAHYDEDWNERVSCRHEIPCSHDESYDCGTKESPQTCTRKAHSNDGYEHPYDVDEHPPTWYFNDTLGGTTYIDLGYFEYLCKHFGNKTFVELNRNVHDNDGDRYTTHFKMDREKLIPVSRMQTYENRVQASRSIFKFKQVEPKDIKEFGLYSYPEVSGRGETECILGPAGNQKAKSEKEIQYLNSVLGRPKQVRMMILIFQDQPLQAAYMQESYWMGGNKNEFILCVGVNKKREVQWGHVISWTEVEALKVGARTEIYKQKGKQLDLLKLIRYNEIEIPKQWVRKQFADFNYLTVEPPLWAVITTYILVLLSSLATYGWCLLNEFTSE